MNLLDFVKNIQSNNNIIVTFSDCNYRNLAIVFAEHLDKLNIKNYIIISADQIVYEHLKNANINTFLIPKIEDNFWIYRTNIIKNIFDNGYHIIHSDLDAIWKNNPNDYFQDDTIDLFYSQGMNFPSHVFMRNKIVLCCGFYYIKNNNNTKKLMEDWCINIKECFDDQFSINDLLIETDWQYQNENVVHHQNFIFFCNSILGTNKKYNLKIILLPMSKFQRIYLGKDGIIYHIGADKTEIDKFKCFSDYGIISFE